MEPGAVPTRKNEIERMGVFAEQKTQSQFQNKKEKHKKEVHVKKKQRGCQTKGQKKPPSQQKGKG